MMRHIYKCEQISIARELENDQLSDKSINSSFDETIQSPVFLEENPFSSNDPKFDQ